MKTTDKLMKITGLKCARCGFPITEQWSDKRWYCVDTSTEHNNGIHCSGKWGKIRQTGVEMNKWKDPEYFHLPVTKEDNVMAILKAIDEV